MPEKLSSRSRQIAMLYVSDELNASQRKRFVKQLERSPLLQTFVDELRLTVNLTGRLQPKHPPKVFLQHQRNLLRARIETLPGKSPVTAIQETMRTIAERLADVLLLQRRPALAAISYLLVGLIVGRFFLVSSGPSGTAEVPQASLEERIQTVLSSGQLASARIDPTRNGTDRITFRLKAEDELVYSGGVEEKLVKDLLYYLLLNESNPGKRLRSIKLISDLRADEEIKTVLVSALLSDENPGVRLRAIRNLAHYPPDRLIRDACTKVLLEDENTIIRMDALRILARDPDEQLLPVLQAVSRLDANESIRLKAGRLLEQLVASPESWSGEEVR